MVIPFVCKPWKLVSHDPLFYLSLDLRSFQRCGSIDDLLQLLLSRSQGRLLHITVPTLYRSRSLYLLPHGAPLLEKLHIPECKVDNKWAKFAAPLMPNLMDLNFNYCSDKLSFKGLEAFGRSCKKITHLRRNRWIEDERSDGLTGYYLYDREDIGYPYLYGGATDREAMAIAEYYPNLKHLELQGNWLTEKGLEAIMSKCPLLEYLDLEGCPYLEDEKLMEECKSRLKVFVEPGDYYNDGSSYIESYNYSDCSSDSEYYGSGSCDYYY